MSNSIILSIISIWCFILSSTSCREVKTNDDLVFTARLDSLIKIDSILQSEASLIYSELDNQYQRENGENDTTNYFRDRSLVVDKWHTDFIIKVDSLISKYKSQLDYNENQIRSDELKLNNELVIFKNDLAAFAIGEKTRKMVTDSLMILFTQLSDRVNYAVPSATSSNQLFIQHLYSVKILCGKYKKIIFNIILFDWKAKVPLKITKEYNDEGKLSTIYVIDWETMKMDRNDR